MRKEVRPLRGWMEACLPDNGVMCILCFVGEKGYEVREVCGKCQELVSAE
jgi:hypothetical protein